VDDPAPPRVLAGRFRVEESLGAGGMGEVFLARDEGDREVE
jgi:serine/threonine protein kinase